MTLSAYYRKHGIIGRYQLRRIRRREVTGFDLERETDCE